MLSRPTRFQEAPPDEPQSFTEGDELEELAERAFSISPRLGHLEEPRKPFPDPLQDLLEEALLGGVEDGEEGVVPDEPVTETAEVFESNEDEPVLESDSQEFESEELEAETGTSSDDEDAAPPDPPQIPPPFSGGPPPRKRSK